MEFTPLNLSLNFSGSWVGVIDASELDAISIQITDASMFKTVYQVLPN